MLSKKELISEQTETYYFSLSWDFLSVLKKNDYCGSVLYDCTCITCIILLTVSGKGERREEERDRI